MTIVFGWNSYCSKSVYLSELGILNKDQQDLKLEYRQKYFHLFYIPVFPIGSFWGVKRDGKWYAIKPELAQSLDNVKPSWKNGIWAWSAPLLGIAVWIIFSISQSMEERADRNRSEQHKSMLSAFFQDKSKTAPLDQKLKTMNAIIDSSLTNIKYERKVIDTSENNLVELYMQAALTHMDTLQGYNQNNTFVLSDFPKSESHADIIDKEYQGPLQTGEWKSSYGDTSSVFREMRKLDQYKYILLIKEYNRVAPEVQGSKFKSGYLFAKARLLSIETGKEVKNFKLLSVNSDQVRHFASSGSGSSASSQLKNSLEFDLERNAIKDATDYVFGKKAL